jgi:hypothetical protein
MNPFSPETWKHQWDVFIGTPYVLMPLITLALMVGWWVGSKLASAKVEGLVGTIESLRASIAVLKDHLAFAVDRATDVQGARAALEKQVEELTGQITGGASNERLVVTSDKVGAAIKQFSTANNALAVALMPDNSGIEFYAELEQRLPGQADRLKAFVASLKPLGVEPQFGRSLFLRWQTASGLTQSAGTIEPTGSIWLLKAATDARLAGNQPAGERYLETIAKLVNGSVKRSENGSIDVRGQDQRSLRLPALIKYESQWREAISQLVEDTSRNN